MGARLGREIILAIDGQPVAGVREKSISLNGEPVDISDDDSAGWREQLNERGEKTVDLSLSGITKSHALKEQWFNGETIKPMTLTYPDGAVISGTFSFVSYSTSGNYKDGESFDGSFQSAGEVTFTAAAAPVNQVKPAIAGTPQVGQTLHALPGLWQGARSFTYVWKLDGTPIEGATGPTYVPIVGDVDGVLTVVVTAVNSAGTTPVESGPSADVIAA